jgi:lipopolysaccharide transport system permease protein
VATRDVTRATEFAVVPPSRARSAWARHRNLLSELVRRDLKARYRGSNLGILWSLLNPLIFMIVYSVIFSQFIRFPVKGASYPVFLLAGLLAWNFFSQAVLASAGSILSNATIVKKVAFPWSFLPLSTILAAFVNYLISLLLLVPVLIFFRSPVGLPLLALPLVIAVVFMLVLGLGLLVAATNVYFRDLEYLLSIALQVGFFATPIIYSLNLVTDKIGHGNIKAEAFSIVIGVNPMSWIATSFQDILAYNRWPVHWQGLLYSTAFSIVALVVGIVAFRRLQGRFAEEL